MQRAASVSGDAGGIGPEAKFDMGVLRQVKKHQPSQSGSMVKKIFARSMQNYREVAVLLKIGLTGKQSRHIVRQSFERHFVGVTVA
jgi:hypothetical protein